MSSGTVRGAVVLAVGHALMIAALFDGARYELVARIAGAVTLCTGFWLLTRDAERHGRLHAGLAEAAHTFASLDSNRTYWLVLHEGGNYYVRDTRAKAGNSTVHIVPDDVAATLTRHMPAEDCPRTVR